MPPTILLVDDRDENLLALESLLEELDAECLKARSGQEALAIALDRELALIFMDVQMPEMDGFEAARLLRGVKKTRLTPIIFVTAISKEERHVFSGYESGAVDYMFKPLQPAVVLAKARVFLQLYEQRHTIENQARALKRKTEQLEAQNEALNHFARVAAHDLKAPLRSLTAFSAMLKDELGDDITPRAAKCVNFLSRAGDRLSALVGDLLEYAKLAHEQDLSPEAVDMGPLVSGVLDDLTALVQSTAAEVTVGTLPTVMGRPAHLRSLTQNLLTNALKYRADDPPRIDVRAARNGRLWRFSIRDNGLGIDPQYQAQIFEAFQRLHGHGKYSGTGIGLAAARRIVVAHGGDIHCESAGEGHGSTFVFTLPGT